MNLEDTLKAYLMERSASDIVNRAAQRHGIKPSGYVRKNLLLLAEQNAVSFPTTNLTRLRNIIRIVENGFRLTTNQEEFLKSAYREAVTGIERLEEGQVYVLPRQFVVPPNYDSLRRFKKWSDVVTINFISKEKHNALFRNAFSSADIVHFYSGYNFTASGSNCKIMLEDCLDAKLMVEANGSLGGKIELLQYEQPKCRKSMETATYMVRVPSISRKETENYVILLQNVPVNDRKNGNSDSPNWAAFNAFHSCMAVIDSANTTRYEKGTRDMCKHVLAAILFLEGELERIGAEYELAFRVNVVPINSQYDYAIKLRDSVIVEEIKGGRARYSTLPKTSRELMQWKRASESDFSQNFSLGKVNNS